MLAFQNSYERFAKRNVQVLGVSSDSLESHEKFAERLKLEFPLVVDEGGDIQEEYDSGRVTYLIDRDGVIRYKYVGMPIIDQLIREIDGLEGS